MYNKGNNLIHTIRQVINNDELFRKILRGLTQTFYHKTVDSKDVETYISKESGRDLSKIFDQYLRTSKIPVLEYKTSGQLLSYRWTNCLEGFNMPVRLANDPGIWLNATTSWKETSVTDAAKNGLQIDKNFYITVKKAE